jgi:uncharacterized membrane protein YhaH (DUF805 family)
MDWNALFLSPRGRINRRDFWIGFAILFAANIVVGVIPFIGQLAGILLMWPQICVHSKRLHDMGRTAWLQVIPAILTVVFTALALVAGGRAFMNWTAVKHSDGPGSLIVGMIGAALIVIGIASLFGFSFVLWIGLSKGEPGANRFGPPPVSLTGSTPPFS